MTEPVIDFYVEKIRKANDLQKTAIAKMLFANFVDEDSNEFVRTNCLAIAEVTWEEYNNTAIVDMLELYSEYMMKDNGVKKRYAERFLKKSVQ